MGFYKIKNSIWNDHDSFFRKLKNYVYATTPLLSWGLEFNFLKWRVQLKPISYIDFTFRGTNPLPQYNKLHWWALNIYKK